MQSARLLLSFAALPFVAASASAQFCPPDVLCPQGTLCAPIVCPLNSGSYSVSAQSVLGAPPVTGELIHVPRFAPGPGQALTQVEVIVQGLLTGAIKLQNTSPTVPEVVQSHLGTSFTFGAAFPQMNNLQIAVSTPIFNDALGINLNAPCAYTGSDAAQHLHLSVLRERRACLVDPLLLSGLFTVSGTNTTVDFTLATLDTSSAVPANSCTLLINQSRAIVTIVYHYCTGAGVGVSQCAGDPTTPTACPCFNWGLNGQGCGNSYNAAGAKLTAGGVTSPDTVVLTANGETPTALSVYLQGNTSAPNGFLFGDGVRCTAGTLKRLYIKTAAGGTTSAPSFTDAGIRFVSAQLGDPIANGTSRWYQVYFRDSVASFCPNPPGGTFNVTNALQIVWL